MPAALSKLDLPRDLSPALAEGYGCCKEAVRQSEIPESHAAITKIKGRSDRDNLAAKSA